MKDTKFNAILAKNDIAREIKNSLKYNDPIKKLT